MGNWSSWRFSAGWIVAVVAAGLLLLIYASLPLGPKLPVYQGKSLYAWASELSQAQQNYSDPNRWKKIQAATEAIRAMGSNALPFVMADIQAHATVKDRVINWLAPRLRFLKLQPRKVEDRWVRGIRALEVLGPMGKPYLPQLLTLVSNSTGYSEEALLALGSEALPAFTNLLAKSKFPQTGNLIGAFANAVYADRIKPEEASVALPYLVQVFRSTDVHGRWYAAGALGAIHQDPDLCVPLLIQGLTNATPSVRESCVQSLGRFGEAASPHAGELADIFDQADSLTRRAICGALAGFHSAAAIAIPILVRGLRDPDVNVRIWAATGLGQLAGLPDQAVPALAQAVDDPNAIVRTMTVQSLGQFGIRTTNVLSILDQKCSDPDPAVRNAATNAMRRITQN
jgi:HEAT repeat protein